MSVAHHAVGEHRCRSCRRCRRARRTRSRGRTPVLRLLVELRGPHDLDVDESHDEDVRRGRPARRRRGGSAASGVGCVRFILGPSVVGSVRGGRRQAVAGRRRSARAARRALRPASSRGVPPLGVCTGCCSVDERHAARSAHSARAARMPLRRPCGRGRLAEHGAVGEPEVDRVRRSAPCRAPRRSWRGTAATATRSRSSDSFCSSRVSDVCCICRRRSRRRPA